MRMPDELKWYEKVFLLDFIKGLHTTLRRFFMPSVTTQYPEAMREIAPRWRGRHILIKRADGSYQCVACGLCAAVCPSGCITVVPTASGNEIGREPARWDIDLGRCVFCGFCQQVCPVDAVRLGPAIELSVHSRKGLMYSKEDLVAPMGTPKGGQA